MKRILLKRHRILRPVAAMLLCCSSVSAQAPDVHYTDTFDDESLAGWSVFTTGEALKRKSPPKVQDGQLYLLPSWEKSHSSAALDALSDSLHKEISVKFDLIMNTGTEGMGIAWVATADYKKKGTVTEMESWEAPSFSRSFGVGFDASNPVNRDPFRGSGNVYDRPQHEVSLHFDDMEIVKRVSEIDFRDEEPHAVQVNVCFVPGGAEVSVTLDNSTHVYERYFIAGMTPYHGRLAMGARNSEIAGDILVDNLDIECRYKSNKPPAPRRIVAIDRKLNDAAHPTTEASVKFPDSTEAYARVICTLALEEPEGGFDPWDRSAHLWLYDDDGNRTELLRDMTPYDRGHTWKLDVTDFLPLISGTRKIEQHCGTQGPGWLVSVSFDFYEDRLARVPFKVLPLWSGSPEIGNPEKPVSDFYRTQSFVLPDETVGAKVRLVVTGHGMSPNSQNAAEFMPINRTLVVNDKSFTNRLWKTDNYLNPCRPQGGTWKYDRAGWAPGDVVRPWEVDVSELIDESRKLTIDYQLDKYINEHRGQTWAPSHLTESQLILYRAPEKP